MQKTTDSLKTYSFTESDIHLITFSLRDLSKNAPFTNTKKEAIELIKYIERIYKENNS